ncbi:hypothetical protein N7474_002768 [Penicillium riverlandense]|uniref:uncharacterized protein n=1 Tax=Penicillium riverlandense TaxID=1903569 RepID=UPI00254682F9|nr:uncharacterized protein N7474_002768 [Penicillium riverlandense]KAJ5825630.1 hypothetical protein N7474_002768 [Penicillium riverlandense]
MLSATPRHSRAPQSHPPSSAARSRRQESQPASRPSLPPYETPEAPLTAEGQRMLASLLESPSMRHLKTHIQHATEKLTDSAGEINDRLCDAKVRYQRSKDARRRHEEGADGNEEEENSEGDDEYRRLEDSETKVNAVTERLEARMRLMIDTEARLQGLTDAVTDLQREETQALTAALGSRRTRRQRQRHEDDGEEEDDDQEDEDFEATPEREMRERNAQNPLSRRVEDAIAEKGGKWEDLSLTERYSTHNAYVGFYRMVHDSKFPGDEVPPLPHSSTWFSHLEDLHTQSSQHQNTSASQAQARRSRKRARSVDSDDIAIERERISLKCPLTLLDYRDPVTSTKCPHSFERDAITDMISRSNSYAPSGGRRVRIVKCPVCDIPLSLADLRADPVLLRRVRRVQERAERAGDDDEDGDGGRDESASRDGLLLTSDGPNGWDEDVDVDLDDEDQRESAAAVAVRVKTERRSVPPEQSVSSEQMKVEGTGDNSDEADGSSENGRTDSSDE